jgi:uncharacterized protein (TIGR03083 family)
MDDFAAMVEVERRELADFLDSLDAAQWRAPSLCAGWQIRDVVVHVLMPYEMSAPRFLLAMARCRFDFDEVARQWVRRNPIPEGQLPQRLRATAQRRFAAGGPAAPLAHLVIHGLDIRQPLGDRRPLPPRPAEILLDQLMSPKAGKLVPGSRVDGLAFVATDIDWRHGRGAEVVGRAADLILAIAGRPATVGALTGEGADRFRRRLVPAAA